MSFRGKIFAMLVRGNLVVKLPVQRVDELVDGGFGKRFDPGHGRLMKQWVEIATKGGDWLEFAREALRFAAGAETEKR